MQLIVYKLSFHLIKNNIRKEISDFNTHNIRACIHTKQNTNEKPLTLKKKNPKKTNTFPSNPKSSVEVRMSCDFTTNETSDSL